MMERKMRERWLFFDFTVRLLDQYGVLACKKIIMELWDGMGWNGWDGTAQMEFRCGQQGNGVVFECVFGINQTCLDVMDGIFVCLCYMAALGFFVSINDIPYFRFPFSFVFNGGILRYWDDGGGAIKRERRAK
ncbi:hypothetical protein ACMFMG_006217 [Clarireedia jacksonii]